MDIFEVKKYFFCKRNIPKTKEGASGVVTSCLKKYFTKYFYSLINPKKGTYLVLCCSLFSSSERNQTFPS
nr:hypothetical protein [Marseillevirus cajuinensis]